MTYTIEQLENLAHEELELEKRSIDIKNRRDEIKAIFLSLGDGAHPAGIFKINIKPGARVLDPRALTTAFPFTARPELYKAVIDTAAVKNAVSPAALEQFKKQNTASVEVI